MSGGGQPAPGPAPITRLALWIRRLQGRRRFLLHALGDSADRAVLLSLLVLDAAIALLAGRLGPATVPPEALVLPVLIGALRLRLASLRVVLLGAVAALLFDGLDVNRPTLRAGGVVVVVLVGALAYRIGMLREQVGVPGLGGEAMLADLRDRLRQQGEVPELPAGWHVESTVRVAGGTSFGGDFLVARVGPKRAELVLVDVSGKGVSAGTRALLLSGALGGLLGAVPPEDFLPAANDYLLAQGWEEGFATAVHVALDLTTGDYVLDSAGHPPPAQFTAGSGGWSLVEGRGPALGLIPDATFATVRGRLATGDALLLYTDGVVEVPGRDLELGVDKLLGEANRLVVRGFHGGSERLLRAVASGASDDRAVLLLWR